MATTHLLPDPAHAAVRTMKESDTAMEAHREEITSRMRQFNNAWKGGGKEIFFAEIDPLVAR